MKSYHQFLENVADADTQRTNAIAKRTATLNSLNKTAASNIQRGNDAKAKSDARKAQQEAEKEQAKDRENMKNEIKKELGFN